MEKGIKNELKLKNIKSYFKKKVTKFGTGAKIDCPKEYLDKEAIVIIEK
ncbi:MAG: DUF2080 family transposase-associated protein [Nanoarchaeota archaeon]